MENIMTIFEQNGGVVFGILGAALAVLLSLVQQEELD